MTLAQKWLLEELRVLCLEFGLICKCNYNIWIDLCALVRFFSKMCSHRRPGRRTPQNVENLKMFDLIEWTIV